ncbi:MULTISPECIES: hypothetical protein [Fusobacterium]|uniref:hypothetical protein n=1 Tax=Fusobacterium TaxID=848 RepID=UPI001476AE80|nr:MULTISPECIES: hypothetical protein [Fusobacterium]NME35585.1 hypothetical protein [Fusobacterium sp. FSA-380-WT-3A]
MKKILSVLFLLGMFLFTGCGDGNYIDTVKMITFDDGKTVEEIAQGYIEGGEFYKLNYSELNSQKIRLQAMFYMTDEGAYSTAKQMGLKLQKPTTVEWKVAGKTEKGKILEVTSSNVVVTIQTAKDGDYISLYMTDIKPKMKDRNYNLTPDEFDIYRVLYEILDEQDKKNN